MSARPSLAALLLAACMAATARPAAAEPAPGPRELAGHVFIPSTLIGDPFTATHFDSATGFGFASFTLRQDGGQGPREATYQLAALAQGFALQVAILPVWALRASASGLVYSGVNAEGALNLGASVGYTASGGTAFSFRLGRRFRLGLSADAEYAPSYHFDVAEAIERSVAAGQVDAGTLLRGERSLTLIGGAHGALAAHRSLGLLFELSYAHALLLDQPGGALPNEGSFSLGTALSFDLRALSPVPLGLLAAYRLQVPVARDPAPSHDLSAGLYYTGRVNLVLGPEAAFRVFPPSESLRAFSVIGTFVMRYYW